MTLPSFFFMCRCGLQQWLWLNELMDIEKREDQRILSKVNITSVGMTSSKSKLCSWEKYTSHQASFFLFLYSFFSFFLFLSSCSFHSNLISLFSLQMFTPILSHHILYVYYQLFFFVAFLFFILHDLLIFNLKDDFKTHYITTHLSN